MCDLIPPGKDWTDVLSALLMPTVVFFGGVISLLQWRINRNRLKNELFDRRYDVYEKIGGFIGNILTSGKVPAGSDLQFLIDTKGVQFLFGTKVSEFTSSLYKQAVELHAVEAETPDATGEEKTKYIERCRVIREWFGKELNGLEKRFEEYLKLEH